LLGLRLRSDAGERPDANATGKTERGDRASPRCRAPLSGRHVRSEYRRGHRELRLPWRRDPGGTGRADRICRPPRDRANHPPQAARGLQTAEFCLQKGLLDMVVPRTEMRSALSRLLAFVGAPRLVPVQIEPAPAAQP